MRQGRAVLQTSVWITVAVIVAGITIPQDTMAYVDPGTTGLLSQILYVLFYGALGAFFYFLRYLKQYLANAKQFLAKFFEARG
jgi:hypothetical protein